MRRETGPLAEPRLATSLEAIVRFGRESPTIKRARMTEECLSPRNEAVKNRQASGAESTRYFDRTGYAAVLRQFRSNSRLGHALNRVNHDR